MPDKYLGPVNLTATTAEAIVPYSQELRLIMDGVSYNCFGNVLGDGPTVTLKHGAGDLIGDIDPREGIERQIIFNGNTYPVRTGENSITGTPFVTWICACYPKRTYIPRPGPSISFLGIGDSIVIAINDPLVGDKVISGMLHYRFAKEGEPYGSVFVDDGIITGLEFNTKYKIVAWVVDDDGIRYDSVATEVTTGAQ